jgi:hypothetical protein
MPSSIRPGERDSAQLAHRLKLAILRPAAVQAEHEQAIVGFGLIQRRFDGARNASAGRFERVFERPRMREKGLRLGLMHAVIDVPEPEIGLRQRRMQRLG